MGPKARRCYNGFIAFKAIEKFFTVNFIWKKISKIFQKIRKKIFLPKKKSGHRGGGGEMLLFFQQNQTWPFVGFWHLVKKLIKSTISDYFLILKKLFFEKSCFSKPQILAFFCQKKTLLSRLKNKYCFLFFFGQKWILQNLSFLQQIMILSSHSGTFTKNSYPIYCK